MRQTKDFSLNYTLLIICEGDKSEPYFYEGLLSLLNQKVGKRQFEYTIYPFPVSEEKSDAQNGRTRRNLSIKDSSEPLPEIKVKGPQPVCWVEAGIDQLGIFSEVGSCHGERCINGYARQRGYWKYSKNNEVFANVTNLWYGIYNSHKLKWQSLAIEDPRKEMYDRNPYLNTYRLTTRLMEVNILENSDQVIVNKGQGHEHIMYREGNIIHFENHSVLPLKMDGVLRVYQIDKNLPDIDEKLVALHNLEPLRLEENDTFQYDLTDYLGDDCYMKFIWEGKEYFCALEDTISQDLDLRRFRVS